MSSVLFAYEKFPFPVLLDSDLSEEDYHLVFFRFKKSLRDRDIDELNTLLEDWYQQVLETENALDMGELRLQDEHRFVAWIRLQPADKDRISFRRHLANLLEQVDSVQKLEKVEITT